MSKTRIPNIVLHGEVDKGMRKPGRPKKSFREGLRNDLKTFKLWPKYTVLKKFNQLVEDRKEWRKMLNKAAQNFQQRWETKRLTEAIRENKRNS